jgi:hypothetical protein
MGQESLSESASAVGGCHAQLGDVGYLGIDARAEHHADESAIVSVAKQPGLVCFEDAATGEADDVVEESERTVKRAVLVVNPGVDVSGVGGVNEFGGDLIVDRRPGDKFDGGVEGDGRAGRVRPEVELHEEPVVWFKASFEEPGVVEEQL